MGQSHSTFDVSAKSLPLDYIYDKDGQTVLKRTEDGAYVPARWKTTKKGDTSGTETTPKGNKRQNAQRGDAPPKKKETFHITRILSQDFNNPNHVVPSPDSSTPSPVQLTEWQQCGFQVTPTLPTPGFEPSPPTPPPRKESMIKSKEQKNARNSVAHYQ